MKNKIARVLSILLIMSNSGFAQQSNGSAPEATAAEAALLFRDMPYLNQKGQSN